MDKTLFKEWQYEFGAWLHTTGFDPKRLVISETLHEDYSKNAFHIFENEDGTYATVYESGCSCYEASQASINICQTLRDAQTLMDEWRGENKRYNS